MYTLYKFYYCLFFNYLERFFNNRSKLTLDDHHYGFKRKLKRLCDKLGEKSHWKVLWWGDRGVKINIKNQYEFMSASGWSNWSVSGIGWNSLKIYWNSEIISLHPTVTQASSLWSFFHFRKNQHKNEASQDWHISQYTAMPHFSLDIQNAILYIS